MNKLYRTVIALLLSIIFYLQSILSLLLFNYVSWFWLDEYVWISAIVANIILVYIIIEMRLGK